MSESIKYQQEFQRHRIEALEREVKRLNRVNDEMKVERLKLLSENKELKSIISARKKAKDPIFNNPINE